MSALLMRVAGFLSDVMSCMCQATDHRLSLNSPFQQAYDNSNIKVTVNTLGTGSFKLFKRPFPGFLTILTL